MIKAQQVSVSPGQTAVRPGQVSVTPYTTTPAQAFDITGMLTAIMPLIMLVMLMQLLKPLLTGMAATAKE